MRKYTKDELLSRKRSSETEDVELGDGMVTVRGLTRGEVNDARQAAGKAVKGDEVSVMDNHFIAYGLVDPEMTPSEVGEWLANAPAGDSVAVLGTIQRLSGLADDAHKSGNARVRKQR